MEYIGRTSCLRDPQICPDTIHFYAQAFLTPHTYPNKTLLTAPRAFHEV